MTALRELVFDDLFKFGRMTLDAFTKSYAISFFVVRLLKFPMLNEVAIAPNEQCIGFILGTRIVNDEFVGEGMDSHVISSHGHVSILSIDNDFRRLGLGTLLMGNFKARVETKRNWYIDIFVHCKNLNAIKFFELMGYTKYRVLTKYFSDDYGYEMRLPLPWDINNISLIDKDKTL